MRIPIILCQGMMTAMMIPINMTTMTVTLMTVGMIHHHSVVQGTTLDVPWVPHVGTVTVMPMMVPIIMMTMIVALMIHHSVVQGATLDVPRGKLCLTLRLSSSQRTSETDWRQNMEEIRS